MKQFGLRSLDELPRLEELVPPDDAGLSPPASVEPRFETAPESEVLAEIGANAPLVETGTEVPHA